MNTDTNQYSGISNPPNGGQVTDVTTSESNDATVPQTAAPSTPPQPTPQGPTGAQGPQTTSPNLPNKIPNAPSKNLAGLPANPPPQQNPAVQKASIFHDVAEALGGGPRYTYSVDATGNMTRTKSPVSPAHLGLAIAMEALTGAAAGAGVKGGPNATGRAAAAGFQAGQQQVVQQDQKQRIQAQEDFNRRAQVLETNMRLYTNARQLGKMDEESIDAYLNNYKDLANKIQTQYPGYVKGIVSYKDLSKYNVTADTAIPYQRIPRLGQDGKQVTDSRGVPQWDIDYLIMDPSFKMSNIYTQKDLDMAKALGFPWGGNENVMGTPLGMNLALNNKSLISQAELFDDFSKDFWDKADNANKTGQLPTYKSTVTPNLPANVNGLADKYAKQYNVDPNIIKAIIQHESGGNPGVKNPDSSAKGLMQLIDSTAKAAGVTDSLNPDQNVNGGTKLFSQLLSQYKNNPYLALAAYASGPGAVKDGKIVDTTVAGKLIPAAETEKNVNQITTIAGLQEVQPTEEDKAPIERPDLGKFVQENRTFPTAIQKFMGAYNSLPAGQEGLIGNALAAMRGQGDEANAALVAKYLSNGNPNAIKTHDDSVVMNNAERKADLQTQQIEERAEFKNEQDQAAQARKQSMLDTIEDAKIPDNVLQMNPHDVITNLHEQGVTIPSDIVRDALGVANYDIDPADFANRNWFKDNTFTRGQVDDVVKLFNPNWTEGNYGNLKKYSDPNSKVMQTVSAAAGVSNHLNLLLQAAKEINSNGAGTGQFPALNKLENDLNYHTGGTAYSRLAGLTNAINGEMGKVLSGGFAPDKEQVNALMKNMTPENSLDQIQALGKLYTGIMYGKVEPFDEEYSKMKNGQHMTNIPDSFTKLGQSYGYDTPWATKTLQNQPNQNQNQNQNQLPGQRPNEIPVYAQGKVVGFTIPGAKGYRPIQ
jgi:hypothetical protein